MGSIYIPLLQECGEELSEEEKAASKEDSVNDRAARAASWRGAMYERRGLLRTLALVGGLCVAGALGWSYATVATTTRPNAFNRPALSEIEQSDLTFSAERCKAEFPLLYPQLEENERYWEGRGGIGAEHIEQSDEAVLQGWGSARIVIKDGQLYIRSFRPDHETRVEALLHLFHTALTSSPISTDGVVPDVEFVLSTADRDGFSERRAGWVLDKRPEIKGRYLAPDFSFAAGWPEAGVPSFETFRRQAREVELATPWDQRGDKAFWRGYPGLYPVRVDLMDRARRPNASEWADIKSTNFHETGEEWAPVVPMPDHCKQRYLVHTEGNSYSGRSKFVLSCTSVVIAHPLEWTQHFHDAFNSDPTSVDQNLVILPGPFFSGLEETVRQLQDLDRTERFKRVAGTPVINPPRLIADNAARHLRGRYLTPASIACYTRSAIASYARSLKTEFTVELHRGRDAVRPKSGKNEDLAALGAAGDVDYASWLLMGAREWPPGSL